MSLHKFAEQVASQGRGDDSLLVHMTPDEVRNLQRFAEANGTTLTINPTTGLPEAGLLSDLFKAVAPIALGAFLGPGAFGITGLGLSAGTAGLVTGGLTTLATGSLSRGLMAGLGAYGGAGLAENLMGAGGNALVAGGAPIGAENVAGAAVPPIEQVNPSNFNLSAADKFSAGAKAVTASPEAFGSFAKQNLGNLAYAAAPIAAGLMVPTTTKLPDPRDSGLIRQMAFNINPDTGKPDPLYGMREMTPVKASEFGNKTFKGQRDLFYQQNPNPYELGVGSLNQPPQQQTTPMAGGGIVALAEGGDAALAAYQAGNYGEASRLLGEAGMSAQDVVSKYGLSQADAAAVAQNLGYTGDVSGLQYTSAPPVVQTAPVDYFAQQFAPDVFAPVATSPVVQEAAAPVVQAATAPAYTQYTDAQIGKYLTDNPTADINAAIKATNADPTAVNRYIASIADPFRGSTDTTGGSGVLGIYNQMRAQGIDPNELYKAEIANDPKYAGYTQPMIQKAYDLSKGAYSLTDQIARDKIAADPKLGYDKQWVNFMDTKGYSIDDMAQAFGLSKNEVRDRYNAVKAAETKVVTPPVVTPPVVTPPVVTPPVVVTPPTSVIPGGFYGNATNPGDITTNPDGTVTVQPNIPYRPYGGFSGMEEVRNAYTKGGGSLGYTAPVPKTAAEHNALYNKQTDDSLDAYNYLMGKGKNLTQRKAETRDRPVMQRYDEAVLGRKMPRLGAKTTDKTTTVVGVPGNPQSYFNEAEYLAANPDVAAELKSGKSNFTSAYEHYLMYGKKEGRKFAGDYQGYLTAAALASAAGAGGGGPGNDGGGGVGGTGGGGSGGNAAGAAAAAAGGNAAPGTGNAADSAAAASAAAAAAGIGEGDSAASGGKRGGQVLGYAMGGGLGSLGSYSDGGRLLKGPGDGVSDSIPATIGRKQQPARLADGEFVIPARIVSELGNGSTDAGAKKLYAMMDRVQRARGKTTGKNKVAANSRSDKYLPA